MKKDQKEILADIEKMLSDKKEEISSLSPVTITDLQTLMIMKERIFDADNALEKARKKIVGSEDNLTAYPLLAYSAERIISVEKWKSFFGRPGKSFNLNREQVRSGCIKKLGEAQERLAYVSSFLPYSLKETSREMSQAARDMQSGEYLLCIFRASKAKAESDVVLSALSMDEKNINASLAKKLDLVESLIAFQSKKGLFPILGYSYYEYARSLQRSDVSSSLVYAEYALELSNLDVYFGEVKKKEPLLTFDETYLWIFLFGLSVGVLITFLIFRRSPGDRL